jgi:hypothetical protein
MGNTYGDTTKKPYSSPKLTNYGTIRELTQTVSTHGHRDGGRPPSFRTHA